ncbi:hypothetical protein [Liquorilactobacillus satsumensis]|uniref:hypothetical protein n=1 Tax=Liquorilactobacillus satsumensis TaxID=259059 RepID=UPI0006D0EEC1|nr:hypothetical protein [Liquorilactobacillus satsumensis]MCC7666440.1 hypothetical protein [Liquorilactobacillus satsumensis]MCP9312980.1 hypothetical protein [Liquorilactobacillus satsumensis]MCP9328926.1 hypothetical protein [Liquorilactobacillus satsumensis]MCP9357635.1 hypothetical protein [Liquorilactobacillus satsumensis]MCP9360136.1 hypothetical protein [Liquorilactobacillus satsumensis]
MKKKLIGLIALSALSSGLIVDAVQTTNIAKVATNGVRTEQANSHSNSNNTGTVFASELPYH